MVSGGAWPGEGAGCCAAVCGQKGGGRSAWQLYISGKGGWMAAWLCTARGRRSGSLGLSLLLCPLLRGGHPGRGHGSGVDIQGEDMAMQPRFNQVHTGEHLAFCTTRRQGNARQQSSVARTHLSWACGVRCCAAARRCAVVCSLGGLASALLRAGSGPLPCCLVVETGARGCSVGRRPQRAAHPAAWHCMG